MIDRLRILPGLIHPTRLAFPESLHCHSRSFSWFDWASPLNCTFRHKRQMLSSIWSPRSSTWTKPNGTTSASSFSTRIAEFSPSWFAIPSQFLGSHYEIARDLFLTLLARFIAPLLNNLLSIGKPTVRIAHPMGRQSWERVQVPLQIILDGARQKDQGASSLFSSHRLFSEPTPAPIVCHVPSHLGWFLHPFCLFLVLRFFDERF